MDSNIRLHQGRGVATVTLNRPEANNAFNRPMLAGLHEVLRQLAADPEVRSVLLLAEGKNFSVGGDIREFERMQQQAERDALFAGLLDDAQAVSRLIRTMPQPVVAAVQGAAAGFGFSLALAADFTIAAQHSVFVAGYAALGLPPDGGMSAYLQQAVGYKKAAEILMLGGMLSAEQALELHLIQQVVPADLLPANAIDLALRLANGSLNAVRRSKQLLNAVGQNTLEAQLHAEKAHFLHSVGHPDFSEGVAAFVAKRPAQFNQQGEAQ